MKNTKLTKNEDKTFNVVDIRSGRTVARNLRGLKAAAYREYYEQELKAAELFWQNAL